MTPSSKLPADADRRICDPNRPGPAQCSVTLNVSATESEITIFSTRNACSQSQGNTWRLEIKDDETFIFHGDVSPATREQIFGIARAFMRFARHGFDREP